MNPQQIQQLAALTTKALGYTENGGKPDIKNPKSGKTGETASIFQFEPGTWKAYSKQVLGDDAPMTADNETHVVLQKVNNWLEQDIKDGYSPEESAKRAASRWNAGVGEPDAYTGKFSDGSASSGVNKKYGVKYDVKGYVDKFQKYLDEFSGGEKTQPEVKQNQVAVAPVTPVSPEQQPQANKIPKKSGTTPGLLKPGQISTS